jgi:hypothetical protein
MALWRTVAVSDTLARNRRGGLPCEARSSFLLLLRRCSRCLLRGQDLGRSSGDQTGHRERAR